MYNLNFLKDGNIHKDDIELGGSYLTRALLQTLPKVYELQYSPLWSFQGENAIPVAGNLAGYTEKVEEVRFEAKGDVSEYVDNTSDIPTLKSAFASDSFNVHMFTIATEHSLQELAAMEVQPTKLQKELAAVDLRLRQSVHRLLVFGNAKRQSSGLFNDPNVPTDSGAYDPSTATWQQHIDFFADRITEIEDNNSLTTRVGTIYIPNKLYSILVRTRQVGDSAKSVMQALREDYPDVSFMRVNECRSNLLERFGVDAVGTNEDLIVFAPVNDNSQIDRLSDAPNSTPPQWQDLTYRTVFYIRSSQTIIHNPQQMLYYRIPTLG